MPRAAWLGVAVRLEALAVDRAIFLERQLQRDSAGRDASQPTAAPMASPRISVMADGREIDGHQYLITWSAPFDSPR
jgi:hypothetical protein